MFRQRQWFHVCVILLLVVLFVPTVVLADSSLLSEKEVATLTYDEAFAENLSIIIAIEDEHCAYIRVRAFEGLLGIKEGADSTTNTYGRKNEQGAYRGGGSWKEKHVSVSDKIGLLYSPHIVDLPLDWDLLFLQFYDAEHALMETHYLLVEKTEQGDYSVFEIIP